MTVKTAPDKCRKLINKRRYRLRLHFVTTGEVARNLEEEAIERVYECGTGPISSVTPAYNYCGGGKTISRVSPWVPRPNHLRKSRNGAHAQEGTAVLLVFQ